ncbi:O-methyltransferase [Candidatus Peregrinibacteria bacterium]|nr:MAG: O-methyltransferase [Candidatus Peregrinibacteria bacterium]
MYEKILRRIEQEDADETVWIVGPATGRMLHWLIRVVQPEFVLEVGTSVGYSAVWMASALESNGKGKLWTVESHTERFERAQKNIAEAGLEHRIHQVKGHAPEVFREADLPAELDFVFLDATKMEHTAYFEAIFPRLRANAFLVVDNVQSHRFGQMQEFIRKLHADPRLKVVEISVGDGLLIARTGAIEELDERSFF